MEGLDHVAIAVRDLDAAIAFYRDLLGLSLTHVEEVKTEGVRVAIFGEGIGKVELMQPTSSDSSVAKFIEKRGEGLHHICLSVSNIEKSQERIRSTGVQLLSEKPRTGAAGSKICFIHPKSAFGVLVELKES